jgi:hypothetical protein
LSFTVPLYAPSQCRLELFLLLDESKGESPATKPSARPLPLSCGLLHTPFLVCCACTELRLLLPLFKNFCSLAVLAFSKPLTLAYSPPYTGPGGRPSRTPGPRSCALRPPPRPFSFCVACTELHLAFSIPISLCVLYVPRSVFDFQSAILTQYSPARTQGRSALPGDAFSSPPAALVALPCKGGGFYPCDYGVGAAFAVVPDCRPLGAPGAGLLKRPSSSVINCGSVIWDRVPFH